MKCEYQFKSKTDLKNNIETVDVGDINIAVANMINKLLHYTP